VKYLGSKPEVNTGEVAKGQFLVIISKNDIKSSNTRIILGLYRNGEKVEEYKSTFVGPNNLDNN
jgi:hypothetical protein